MKTALMILAYCTFLGMGFSADDLRQKVAKDAKWVVHVDFKQLRASQLGKGILAMELNPDIELKVNSLKTLFDFDLRKDLVSFTAYGGKAKSDTDRGVAIVRSKYNKEKMLAILQLGDDFHQEAHNSHQMVRLTQEQNITGLESGVRKKMKNSWCTFYNKDTVVVARRKKALRQALDVLDGKQPNLSQSTAFPELQADAALLIAAADLADMGHVPKAKILRETSSVVVIAKEETIDGKHTLALRVKVVGRTEDSATRIRKAIDGLLAMFQMNLAEAPLLTEVAAILNDIRVTQNELSILVNLKRSADSLLKAVKQMKDMFHAGNGQTE